MRIDSIVQSQKYALDSCTLLSPRPPGIEGALQQPPQITDSEPGLRGRKTSKRRTRVLSSTYSPAITRSSSDRERFSAVDEDRQESHTAGCNFVRVFATPGWRTSSQTYSRQYHTAVRRMRRLGRRLFLSLPSLFSRRHRRGRSCASRVRTRGRTRASRRSGRSRRVSPPR